MGVKTGYGALFVIFAARKLISGLDGLAAPLPTLLTCNFFPLIAKSANSLKTCLTKEPRSNNCSQRAEPGEQVTVMGWVRTFRNNQFIALNDGSTNNNLQVVATLGSFDDALLKRLTTGAP
jgi:hypothetical protein